MNQKVKIEVTETQVKIYQNSESNVPNMTVKRQGRFDVKAFMDRTLEKGSEVFLMFGRDACQVTEVRS